MRGDGTAFLSELEATEEIGDTAERDLANIGVKLELATNFAKCLLILKCESISRHTFNQKRALVGAFSVIVNTSLKVRCEL